MQNYDLAKQIKALGASSYWEAVAIAEREREAGRFLLWRGMAAKPQEAQPYEYDPFGNANAANFPNSGSWPF